MKPYFLMLALFLLILITACHKTNYNGSNNTNDLPPATTKGANTFGCLVNGKVFVPYNSSILYRKLINVSCFPAINGNGFTFFITAEYHLDNEIKDVSIATDSAVIKGVGTYNLGSENSSDSLFGGYSDYGNNVGILDYKTDSVHSGQLIITRFDSTMRIVSGTFAFDCFNKDAGIVHVTQGRFDVTF